MEGEACAQPCQLWDGHETAFTMAASFDWKALNHTVLDEEVQATRGRAATTLAHISMEITLTERRCPCPPGWNFDEKTLEHIRMTSSGFKQGAFRPRIFTLRLESGRFPKPFMEDHGGVESFGDQAYSYGLRLVFDKCPWPLPEDIDGRLWLLGRQDEVTRFVCREGGLYNSWTSGCLAM
jgi:hypothetical protein